MKILKTLLILFMYELSKYVTNAIIIKLQANDTIDQPCDYEKDNNPKRELSDEQVREIKDKWDKLIK